MDHRCLYGHRVPEHYTFAIENRQCPICGAPTVTIEGYKIARRLTGELGMEAMQAFNTLRVIETNYLLTPRVPAEPAGVEDDVEAEIEDPADVPAPSAPAPSAPTPTPTPTPAKVEPDVAPAAAYDGLEEDFFGGAD